MAQMGQLAGFPDVFLNLDTIAVLFFAWAVILLSFFILAVQLFVTLIEFKLTTLAGFVLVPFALWNKTAFLAERVLGNVVSSGIKVLVLAVIVGIGTTVFADFSPVAGADPTLDNALALVLGALALLGLGIFGPGIATGLVSGAPQLGAGAAAGTALGAAGLVVAGGAATLGGAKVGAAVARSGIHAAATLGRGAHTAFKEGVGASTATGAARVGAGMASVARAGAEAAVRGARSMFSSADAGAAEAPSSESSSDRAPDWARRLHRGEQISRGLSTAAHTVRSADHGGQGASPSLREEE
jgi:type IV secretion system protein TrbL